MGCNVSQIKPDGKMTANEKKPSSIEDTVISSHDKHYIKRTWKNLNKSMPEIGAKIFLLIFSRYPHVKQIFPCRDVTGDALLQDPHFRGHATRFMQAVGAAVDNIDQLNASLAPLLFSLGQQHIYYEGFQMSYFDAFVEAILLVFEQELGAKFTPEVARAWTIVFQFIQKTLKEGYMDGKADPSKVQHPHKKHREP